MFGRLYKQSWIVEAQLPECIPKWGSNGRFMKCLSAESAYLPSKQVKAHPSMVLPRVWPHAWMSGFFPLGPGRTLSVNLFQLRIIYHPPNSARCCHTGIRQSTYWTIPAPAWWKLGWDRQAAGNTQTALPFAKSEKRQAGLASQDGASRHSVIRGGLFAPDCLCCCHFLLWYLNPNTNKSIKNFILCRVPAVMDVRVKLQ